LAFLRLCASPAEIEAAACLISNRFYVSIS
jgi:hypothetical protein